MCTLRVNVDNPAPVRIVENVRECVPPPAQGPWEERGVHNGDLPGRCERVSFNVLKSLSLGPGRAFLSPTNIPVSLSESGKCVTPTNSFYSEYPELQKWSKDTTLANDLWISAKTGRFENRDIY